MHVLLEVGSLPVFGGVCEWAMIPFDKRVVTTAGVCLVELLPNCH